jgi:hypothetical protein
MDKPTITDVPIAAATSARHNHRRPGDGGAGSSERDTVIGRT